MDLKNELEKLVGAGNVLDSPETLEGYSSDGGIYPPGRPTIVVKVTKTEDVEKVVNFANDNSTPVTPVSSGVHFQGCTIPYEGGIVLDLSNLTNILEIDAPNRRVRIEPGVTWGQITDTLAKENVRVISPLLPHASRSVITDYLEREVPVIPKYEFAEPLMTYEIVWPNGEVFRTGSASVPGYPDAPSKGVNPAGPGLDFYRLPQGAQGTMGVINWANLKLEYLPKIDKIFFMPFDDINDAIEPIYKIPRVHIGQEFLLLNHVDLALILAKNLADDYDKLIDILPTWTLILTISGPPRRPEERIDYEVEALFDLKKQYFQDMPVLEAIPGVPGGGRELIQMLRKPWPAEETYWKNRLSGACQSLFFICRPEDAPSFYEEVLDEVPKYGYPLEDLGVYLQPVEQSRVCHLEFNLFYDPEDPVEKEKIRIMNREIAQDLLDMGAVFTRPYGDLADMVYEKATSYTTALKRVKKMFDPNNIMNPGRLCF